MAIKSYINIIKNAVTKNKLDRARESQYKESVIDFTFDTHLTRESVENIVRQGIWESIPTTRRTGVGLSVYDNAVIEQAVMKAVKTTFSVTNVSKIHKSYGYTIKKSEADARKALGSTRAATSDYVVINRGTGRGTYAGYYKSFWGKAAAPGKFIGLYGKNNAVVRDLVSQCIDLAIDNISPPGGGKIKTAGGTATPNVAKGKAQSAQSTHRRRLHGPVSTRTKRGPATATGAIADDTSVPVVHVLDFIKENRSHLRKRAKNNLYSGAEAGKPDTWVDIMEQEIWSEMDNYYEVNRKSTSDNVKFENEIRIKMSLGHEIHQQLMEFADKKQLTQNLDSIKNYVIANISSPAGLNMEGSRTSIKGRMTEITNAAMIMGMFPHTFGKSPDMRLRVNKRLVAAGKKEKISQKGKGQDKGGKSSKTKGSRARGVKRKDGLGAVAASVTKSAANARTAESPIALRNLLNELLPQMIATKMVAPALRYQTGRFANSVRVEMVTQGPRGGTYIDYDYMKMPYETFVPGNKQGSTMRDPRKIIASSIRELATGIIGKQPTAIRGI